MGKYEPFLFLKKLAQNNNRSWFQENKDFYNSSRSVFEISTEFLIQHIRKFDKNIGTISAKDCIFRIYRDVRFSTDKSPYKTHFGAVIAKHGRKSEGGFYYFHVEPENSFLAGGIYRPSSDHLLKIRTAIFNNPKALKKILSHPDFIKIFGTLSEGKLKKAPRGFPKDFPDIELLKYKNYLVVKNVPDVFFDDPAFLEKACDIFRLMLPLNNYINATLDDPQ